MLEEEEEEKQENKRIMIDVTRRGLVNVADREIEPTK